MTQIINEIEIKRSGSKNDMNLVKMLIFLSSFAVVVVILVSNQNEIFVSTLDNRVNAPYYIWLYRNVFFFSTRVKYASNNKIMEELNIK